MAATREDIIRRIAELNLRATQARHDGHPEIAVPLLKQALELHRIINSGLVARRSAFIAARNDLDVLDTADLDVLQSDAGRTALDIEDFEPLDATYMDRGEPRITDQPGQQALSCNAEAPSELNNGLVYSQANDVLVDSLPGADVQDDFKSNDEDLSDCYSIEDEFELKDAEQFEIEFKSEDDEDFEAASSATATDLDGPRENNEAGLPEPEEYDEAPTREDLQTVQTDSRIPRAERAFQEAMAIGTRYGWNYDGIRLLMDVFTLHWWGSAKRAMLRELEAGMTPMELKLAMISRQVWVEHPEFHENRGRGRFSYPHPLLPWPTALAIARQYISEPDPEEIDFLLTGLHDDWQCSTVFVERFPSFYEFVRLQVGMDPQCLSGMPGWSFVPDANHRNLDDDAESLLPIEWSHGWGCYHTPPAQVPD